VSFGSLNRLSITKRNNKPRKQEETDDRIVDDVPERCGSPGQDAGRIAMRIQQNFTLAPAHAHLNLIGGVLLFLFGLYYRLAPAAGTTTLAKVHG
jgi:hypothetical protein